jgi:hypothetical protein
VTSKNTLEVRRILESIGVRPRPIWVRGRALIEADEIILVGETAERYSAFEPEHAARLLLDLGNLAKLGEIVEGERTLNFRLTDPDRALDFVKTHGLLWHGPEQVGTEEARESLKDWFVAGAELAISTATYSCIKRSQEEGFAEPVRYYFRTLRDAGIFKHLRLPDDDGEMLNYACIQLAERISLGMADCTPTFSAACGLLRSGVKVGGVGDFRFGNDCGSLVGAANYHLAGLIARKELVRECEECGEMFLPVDPRQRYHKKCGARKRQRERRKKDKAK